VTPMEPIPETVEALDELDPADGATGLLEHLAELAARGQTLVPDLVGVSLARYDRGVTFTLVATPAEMAVLDAVQYVADGPCVEGAIEGTTREYRDDDILDEASWRLFAEATAARAVRSTLTLPLVGDDGGVLGTVNLYGGSPRAFVGLHEELAEIFGAWAAGAVANADLSFMTLRAARDAPAAVREAALIDTAIGILAADLDVDVDTAENRLRVAAEAGGVPVADLAREIVQRQQDRDEDTDR
jgi:GAF domain-containing protein